MTWKDLPLNPSTKMLRQFGGLCLLFFGIAAFLRWHRHADVMGTAAFGGLAALGGLLALVQPRLLRPIFIGWTVAVFPIGWAVSKLVMAVAFFVVVTPLALVMRLAGRDALALRRTSGATTYWLPKPQASDLKRYLSQF